MQQKLTITSSAEVYQPPALERGLKQKGLWRA